MQISLQAFRRALLVCNIIQLYVSGAPIDRQANLQRYATNSDVRGHGHAAGNVSTFFNSKSENCLALRLSVVSVAKNHPKVFRYADSN